MAALLKHVADFIWFAANTNFGTALLGALAGAVAGALSAQQIASIVDHRKQTRDEFSTIVRSITLTYGITSLFLNMKEQHVRRMQEQYAETCIAEKQFQIAKHQGFVPADTTFQFVADLSVLEPPPLNVEALSKLVLEHTQSQRAVVFLTLLTQSMENVATILKKRTALIAELKALPSNMKVSKYLALPDEDGNVDARFSGQIAELGSAVDSSIYFSMRLSDILIAYGKRLAKNAKQKNLRVPSPYFDKAAKAGLLPDSADFKDHEDQLRAWKEEDRAREPRGVLSRLARVFA